MSTHIRSVLVTLVTVVAVVLTPAMAMACRITNATPWGDPDLGIYPSSGMTVYVWFSCGQTCGSYFEIEPGSYVNTRHGQGGQAQACTDSLRTFPKDPNVKMLLRQNDTVSLSGNGEERIKWRTVSEQGPGPTVHWNVYDSNNSVVKSQEHDVTGVSAGTTYCWDGAA